MTCEDYDETQESVVERGASRISSLLVSAPARRLAGLLPADARKAMATIFFSAASALGAGRQA